MIKIKTILYPTDLSLEADEALRYALALAKAYDAKLMLLYCRQAGSVPDWINSSRAPELFRLSLFSRLDANELKLFDWAGVVCEDGEIGLTISKEAETTKADLIVMRSRRRPRAAVLLGSTAETVCRTAPCPVLVTHSNETEWVGLSTEDIDLRRILVTHDFSPNSELALKYGCSLAQEYQTEMHVLHVLDHAGHREPELAWSASRAGSAYAPAAARLQQAIPKEASLWCNIVNAVRIGKPHEEVLAYAKEHEIDLICMGAGGSDWSLSKLFGSTVDRVLRHAPCPVLVVRPIKESSVVGKQNAETQWEHFPHEADMGVRGFGNSKAEAFEHAALALTAVITDPEKLRANQVIEINCEAPDDELLFVDWLNAIVYEMATQSLLFSRFEVHINGPKLRGKAWGEKVDVVRHQPAVEVKGATYTALRVAQDQNGSWLAQCVVDV